MPDAENSAAPVRVPCVGAVILDGSGRLLLVRRAHDPGAGRWSLPGGRIEPGESAEQALAREVLEETGLEVSVGPVVGHVVREASADLRYDIADHACAVAGGTLSAGDDADDVRWVDNAEFDALPTSEGLLDTLTEWGILPLQR